MTELFSESAALSWCAWSALSSKGAVHSRIASRWMACIRVGFEGRKSGCVCGRKGAGKGND